MSERPTMGATHASGAAEGLKVLASGTFAVEGEAYKLITFLNQTLKDKGIIFGMSKRPDGLVVTVYQTRDFPA